MIQFNDWSITPPPEGEEIGRQFDNLSRTLRVQGDLPEGWTWAMLVKVDKAMDVIPLAVVEGGAEALLTEHQLALSGCCRMQLRGTRGEEVRHTNVIQTYIPASLVGEGQWPEVPSVFTALERRLAELAGHPPIPGGNGYWMVWDAESDAYEESEFPLPALDGGTEADSSYERIETITLAEDTYSIERTAEPGGTPYGFTHLILVSHTAAGSAAANIVVSIYVEQTERTTNYITVTNGINTGARHWQAVAEMERGRLRLSSTAPLTSAQYTTQFYTAATDDFSASGNIWRVLFRSAKTDVLIPAGSVFEIWGVRA